MPHGGAGQVTLLLLREIAAVLDVSLGDFQLRHVERNRKAFPQKRLAVVNGEARTAEQLRERRPVGGWLSEFGLHRLARGS